MCWCVYVSSQEGALCWRRRRRGGRNSERIGVKREGDWGQREREEREERDERERKLREGTERGVESA